MAGFTLEELGVSTEEEETQEDVVIEPTVSEEPEPAVSTGFTLEDLTGSQPSAAEPEPAAVEPTAIDPAVQQEAADRQAMIKMMGVDPYTGEVVNNNPVSMIPGILDINEDAAAEFNRLKGLYPEFFPTDFQVETDRPWYQFGFGEKPTERVRGTAADKIFTYSDGRQQVAPADYQMVTDESGVEVLVPGNATEEQIAQAKMTGVFTDTPELPELSRSMYDSFAATPEGREAA
ncbi:hypothetical protein OAD55_07250, partial [Planktomarina temperata]|nr:hypothetical protein [Planktomarina temperata]